MKFLLAIDFVFLLLLLVGHVLNCTECQEESQAENRIGYGYVDSNQLIAAQNMAGVGAGASAGSGGGGFYRNYGYANYAGGFAYPPIAVHTYRGDFFGGTPRYFAAINGGGDLNIGEDYAAQRFDANGGYTAQHQHHQHHQYQQQPPLTTGHNLPIAGHLYGIAYMPHNDFAMTHYNALHSANYGAPYQPMRYTTIAHNSGGDGGGSGGGHSYPALNREYRSATGFPLQNLLGHSLLLHGGGGGGGGNGGAGAVVGAGGDSTTTSLGIIRPAAGVYNGHYSAVLPATLQPVHNF